MRAARGPGEGGRNGKHPGTRVREVAVEIRKPKVVANGHAELGPGRLGEHCLGAGLVCLRLAIRFTAIQVDVEHMDFVVARLHRAIGADQHRPVGELWPAGVVSGAVVLDHD